MNMLEIVAPPVREPNSPFLPGTNIQYAWDSTSLSWLKECPRKYYYHMIEGYVGKGESVHLKFGLLIHKAFEDYERYRAGHYLLPPDGGEPTPLSHNDALREVVREAMIATWEHEEPTDGGRPWSPDHASKNRDTLIRTIIWYLDQFEHDPAQTVILANGKPAVELTFKLELAFGPTSPMAQTDNPDGTYNNQPFLYCGHLDRLVNFNGGTFVMDFKTTTTTISQSFFDGFDPDTQMTGYSMAAKVIYNEPIKGVIINAIQVAVGFTRVQRGFTFRTDGQIDEWLADLRYWFAQAEGYAEAGYWPMNDKSCHKYGGCPFRKVCSKDPRVRQTFLDSDFIRRSWNPLEAR